MVSEKLSAVLFLCKEKWAQLLSLVWCEVAEFFHVDTERKQKLLLKVDDDEMIVVEDFAERMKLLKTSSDIVRHWLRLC